MALPSFRRLLEKAQFALTAFPRVAYVGWPGGGNLGDHVIFEGIRELFRQRLSFFTSNWFPSKVAKAKRYVDIRAVFLGGGTLIGWGAYREAATRLLDAFPSARFIVFGTGVKDALLWREFGVDINIPAWREVLRRSDSLSVRGPLSKMFLQDWGVAQHIQVIGDPAIWLARDRVVEKQRRKRIAINLGPSKGRIYGQDEESVLRVGAELLRKLSQDRWQITLFPVYRDDVAYLAEAAKRAGLPQLRLHTDFLNIPGTLAMLREQDVLIGEKLHSVVLAHCVYTPALMLAYRTKCLDYMESVGCREWAFQTNELDSDLIIDRLRELYAQVNSCQHFLLEQLQIRKGQLQEASRTVCALLES